MSAKDPTLKKLIEAGAEVIGGDVYHQRIKVGMLRHGTFMLMPEGEEVLKSIAAAPAKAAGKSKQREQAAPADQTTPEGEAPQS